MIEQIIDFLYKGKIEENTLGILGNLKFILSKYFIILFSFLIIAVIFSFLGLLRSNTESTTINHAQEIPTIAKILIACIFAPIIEELIFRLPLIIDKTNIIISTICFIVFLFFFTKKYFTNYEYIRYIFISVLFIGCMYFSIFKYDYLHPFLNENRLFIIHFCSILFCIAHYGNYNFNTNSYAPYLMLLSVLINGYYFSYIRLRFGIEYSIFIHMFHNTIIFIPAIVKFITR